MFNSGTLFKDKQLENLINRVDDVVDQLPVSPSSFDDEINTGTFLKQVFSSINEKEQGTSSIEQMLENVSTVGNRLDRYRLYDEIYSSVQIVKRIVKVFINNILLRDAVKTNAIVVKETSIDSEKSDVINKNYVKFGNKIVDHFKLERQLRNVVVRDMLKYGDHFIEIIDLKNDIVDMPQSNLTTPSIKTTGKYVSETFDYIEERLRRENGTSSNVVVDDCVSKCVDCLVEFDDTVPVSGDEIQSIIEADDKLKKEEVVDDPSILPLNRILLKFHNPKNIITLDTRFGTILGYVELTERETDASRYLGVGARFASVVQQMGVYYGAQKTTNEDILQQMVTKIIKKLVTKIGVSKEFVSGESPHTINKKYEDDIREKLGDSLFYMVKRIYLENVTSRDAMLKKMNVRFISTNRMEQFCIAPIEYAPYGTSVIDALVYPAKLYILTQLANVVTKLSRAAIVRKWILETGVRDHHSQLIQKLIRELRNQKVTVDDILSFKSIPKVLSDFKDMILLSKKGQRFLDVEVSQGSDPNIKIQDLEDLRRELIALSGVPAPYLGYADQTELREQLVNINISFANEIISMQSVINTGMNELCNKISDIYELKKPFTNYATLTLKPPIILLLQLLEATVSSIGNVQQMFMGINIPMDPYYFLKQYLPSIDWVDFQQKAEEFELVQKAKGGAAGAGGMGGGM